MESKIIALIEGIVVAAVIIMIGQGIDKGQGIMPETDVLDQLSPVALTNMNTFSGLL